MKKKLTSKEVDAYIKKHWLKKTIHKIASELGMPRTTVQSRGWRMGLPDKKKYAKTTMVFSIPNQIKEDKKNVLKKKEENLDKKKYDVLLGENLTLKSELEAIRKIKPVSTYVIPPYRLAGNNEGTAVIVASDWHLGETVEPEEVNGLNNYNKEIAEKRSMQFFRDTLRVVQVQSQALPVKHCVLALLGDFINNMMFEEAMEMNSMLPIKEVIYAQNIIASGIEYYLKNSDYNFTIVCHSGNHGRATKKPRNGKNEAGHSFEYLLYHQLAQYFKNEKRVNFMIPESYLSYISVYDKVLCFHHGHNVRYQGGIGGITIPMLKAIANWENARRADVYVCGHFHQFFDGNKFVVNSSMVGYNSYAIAIKAPYEPPTQTVFFLDKKRGRTITAKIHFDV